MHDVGPYPSEHPNGIRIVDSEILSACKGVANTNGDVQNMWRTAVE